MTRIILIGSNGQLGTALRANIPGTQPLELVSLSRDQFDISSPDCPAKLKSLAPDIVINASAYTQVDLAESEPDKAHLINNHAVDALALACSKINTRLIHISTDFVFDGRTPVPRRPEHATNPLSVYGHSKLAGEQAIQSVDNLSHLIIRTSWLYSSSGNNFVKTMLRLFKERPVLNVVYDQIGSPTWAHNLAAAVWRSALTNINGIYHYTDAGIASWYDFAIAIQQEAQALGLIDDSCRIKPILSEAYPTPAIRPNYSVLDCESFETEFGLTRHHWQNSLRKMLKEIA